MQKTKNTKIGRRADSPKNAHRRSRTRTVDHLPKSALQMADMKIIIVRAQEKGGQSSAYFMGKVQAPDGKKYRVAGKFC